MGPVLASSHSLTSVAHHKMGTFVQLQSDSDNYNSKHVTTDPKLHKSLFICGNWEWGQGYSEGWLSGVEPGGVATGAAYPGP